MTMFTFAAAALALGTAAPEPAPAPVAPVAQSSAKVDPSTDTRRICMVDATTGTRFARKTCLTRAEWAAEGIDPLAKR
jgi:hypothetical protein